ncbi:AzlD domain-containing protein [Paenibacillus albicereus]|uniref:AzlD domain-containing protein n=1 Tax=Paenibacillus albicereus TaxID=2726185 RepID=A0A6H2GTI0_9BACL|nr:AzlD domain-containing protein [Paenibacillus albicereus]QJC50734.1 AzlD domain-containing protein [Paenibacillus albicereus]
MSVSDKLLLAALGGMLVTLLPRILPFLLVRGLRLPEPVRKWLSFIPLCLLGALVMESLLMHEGGRTALDLPALLALLPALLVAAWTRSLLLTVAVGIAAMALLRLAGIG